MPRYIDAEALRQDLERQIRMLHTLSDHVIKENDPYIVRHEAMRQQTINQWCDGFFKYLDTRPTANVEPVRHGRWIYIGNSDETEGMWECSKCGYQTHHEFALIDEIQECGSMIYCEHCGAKMDGESEVEDDA